MSTEVQISMDLAGKEILPAGSAPAAADASGRELKADGLRISKRLTATTTPKVEFGPIVWDITMSGTEQSLDLTAAALQGGRTGDASGKKVIAAMLKPAHDNSGDITVRAHATNGYDLFGNTTTGLTLKKGQDVQFAFTDLASQLAAVDGTHKIIELSGAAGRKILIVLYLGDGA